MRKDKSINAHSYEMAVFKAMRTIMHLIASVHFGYSCYFYWSFVNVPVEVNAFGNAFGNKLKYLTFWDAILQTIYFSIALLNDVIGSNENVPSKVPVIRRIKDYVFCSLAFPTASFVGVSFWSLMAVDRELVFPKVLDDYFPTWLNHVMHTNIMVFIILEMFLTFRQYPSVKRGLSSLTVFFVSYLIWVFIIYIYAGLWVYPVLQVLNWPLKIVFFLSNLVGVYLLYFTGEFLNNKVWAKQISQLKRTGKKKAN